MCQMKESECFKSGRWFVWERFSDICWHCQIENLKNCSAIPNFLNRGCLKVLFNECWNKLFFHTGPVGYNIWENRWPKNGPYGKFHIIAIPSLWGHIFQISANMAQEEGTEEQVVER